MCGICGSFRPGGAATEDDQAVVSAMMRNLEHRGPDGHGLWADAGIVLGHLRLAIIDLEGGYQPLLNETGEVAVVFNGEIYNYRELRAQLLASGHQFRTASDTEVLVHGYEQWGDELPRHLRGMFAFALWDGRGQRMLLVRDRLGVKPLYYHRSERDGRLLFASEIKALFADPSVPREMNAGKLSEYLAFRSVFGEETLFAGIRELEPGTTMVLEGGRSTTVRYWSPSGEPADSWMGDGAVEQGRQLLRDAVRARLVSDVELGTITSGGLDSSLVSAIAAQLSNGVIETFCAGFEDAAFDERPFAREVAAQIRSRHHDLVVSPTDIVREFDRLTWAHDEPLTHPNSIPMHLIFRQAKEEQGVTVLLSGEGADEIFGGYEWYSVATQREHLRRIPGLSTLARTVRAGRISTLRRVLEPDYLLSANAVSRLEEAAGLPNDGGDALAGRRASWEPKRKGIEGLFIHDQKTYLPPLLQRQDRMSMAAGLEARVPFLDHILVEWANSLPAAVKVPGGRRKDLLKRMARGWLPDHIIDRRKVGFAMPLGAWMRRGGPLEALVERIEDRSSSVRAFTRKGAVDRVVEEHRQGVNRTDLLWSLVALQGWSDIFLGSSLPQVRLPGAATGRPVAEIQRKASAAT